MIARFWGRPKAASHILRLIGTVPGAAGALAGFALSAFVAPVSAAAEVAAEPSETAASAPVTKSEEAARVASWIAASRDNGPLPYMIIDKKAATLFLYDAEGKPVGTAPVLIGIAEGDEASPDVGSKQLSQLGPAEKTTPAGRFLAKFGWAAGRQRVLWVDYYTSVALHPVVTGNRRERRRERLLTPEPDDNRITFGCINVPPSFYIRDIGPLFREEGGIVYVLPDNKPLEDVFPLIRVQPFLDRGILTPVNLEG
jgi:hypothetical protein